MRHTKSYNVDKIKNIKHLKILFKFDLDNFKRVVNLIFIIFPPIRKFLVDDNKITRAEVTQYFGNYQISY